MITLKEVRQFLRYQPQTGRLFWCIGRRTEFQAGYLTRAGYIRVRFGVRTYLAHNLIWLLVTGKWPKNRLDHKNTIRNDNRWGNLREASNTQNQGNRKRNANNTSGFKGVSWHAATGTWMASIRQKGKKVCLGFFVNPEFAHRVYMKAAKKHFGEFARAS